MKNARVNVPYFRFTLFNLQIVGEIVTLIKKAMYNAIFIKTN